MAMAETDFFDEDLLRRRLAANEPATERTSGGSDRAESRGTGDVRRIARLRQEAAEKSARASEDLERLRQRQEELEREKRDVEELRRRLEEYERGRRDMLERLEQSLVQLEKEEVQTQKMVELLASIRRRFKAILAELQTLNEESWPEQSYREELVRALSILENARQEFNRSLARLEAARNEEGAPPARPAPLLESGGRASERSFREWVLIGFALTLPLIVFFALAIGAWWVLRIVTGG